MIVNFKGYVFLGVECSGRCHSYEDLVPVDLNSEDILLLKTKVIPNQEGDIVESLRTNAPELFEKINTKASLFAIYATLHEGIVNGTLEEYLPEGKDIEDFIREDINNGLFKPNKTEGEITVKEDWYQWEENYLQSLSYIDRVHYITNRYGIDKECISEIENDYSLFLPKQV